MYAVKKMSEFIFNGKHLPLGERTYIMGILNVTPDSFSDGGRYNSLKAALRHTEEMLSEGADIIDVGAVSTRPFSEKVTENEEWTRLKDILPAIKREFPGAVVSVDTTSPLIAEKSILAGADIINDVSGVFLSDMAEIIKKYGCGWVVMHGGISLRKTEEITAFPDGIVNDVNTFFSDMLKRADDFGIPHSGICLDPGFGFSKTNEQNRELLGNFGKLQKADCALMCALSRKRFIREMAGDREEDIIRLTVEADRFAIENGADIIRVHDVKEHMERRF